MSTKTYQSKPVAIVGMASHFPDARSLFDFWNNVYQKKDSITDNLSLDGYWKKDDYYAANSKDKDKTYAHKAGWIPPIDFDPVEFKLPPNMLESVSTTQLFALHVAKKALLDARIIGEKPIAIDRSRVGVILGGAGNGNTSFLLAARQQVPFLTDILSASGLPRYLVDDIIERLLSMYLEWNEDSFPGFLGNVACGRISSFFDFGGTSNMVDAACASSFAAMKAAMGELESGSCDAVLTGGVNLENSIFSFLCFSRTPALSPTGTSRPFDSESDGMMLGDGVGLCVLKRLEDAERDGDRIYAVIKSIAGSSDGRAKSIFAPRIEGQMLALDRAYAAAGISPVDIELIEAHGTGTFSGDQTELNSLNTTYQAFDSENKSIAVGSIKSQIGHTRCAAGAAAAIKVALGLYHKVLPATINVKNPNKLLAVENTPFYVNSENRPWIKDVDTGPRRAGVSAFGFGGTNYHMIMEEYEAEHDKPYRLNDVADVIVLHAASPSGLLKKCKGVLADLGGTNMESAYAQLLLELPTKVAPHKHARLGFAAEDANSALALLSKAVAQLESNQAKAWEHPLGIYYRPNADPIESQSAVVALFPGQGSQYVNMARHIANEFPQMRKTISAMDKVRSAQNQTNISRTIFPPPVFSSDAELKLEEDLRNTKNAQPAIGAISLGYYKILESMGFQPSYAAGHSFGELTALHVAGALSEQDFFSLAVARGQLMDSVPKNAHGSNKEPERGAMLALSMAIKDVEGLIEHLADVSIANINSANQIVLGGSNESINNLYKELQKNNVRCSILPVAAAFHTKYVAHAAKPFAEILTSMKVSACKVPVFSNVTADRYSDQPIDVSKNLSEQLTSTVKFKQMIERIYEDGGRYFVEIGPKGVLGKLVADILGDRAHTIVSVDPSEKVNESGQLRKAVAKLAVHGLLTDYEDYFRVRRIPEEKNGRLVYNMNGGNFFFEATKKRQEYARRKDSSLVDRFIKESMEARIESEVAKRMEIERKKYAGSEPALPLEKVPEKAKGRYAEYENKSNNAELLRVMDSNVNESNLMKGEKSPMENRDRNSHDYETTDLSVFNNQIKSQHLTNEVHQQFQLNQKDYIQFLNTMIGQQFSMFDKHQSSVHFKEIMESLNQSFQLLEHNQRCYHQNHENYFRNQQALMGGLAETQGNAEPMLMGEAQSQDTSGNLQQQNLRFNGTTNEPGQRVDNPKTNDNGNTKTEAANKNGARQDLVNNGGDAVALNIPTPSLPSMPEAQSFQKDSDKSVSASKPVADGPKEISMEDKVLIEKLKAITAELLTENLIKIIGEKTGYPEDMIGVDMDLEADLGIDSIKRIEILGAMFQLIEEDTGSIAGGDAEDYSELETFDIDQFSSITKLVVFLLAQFADLIVHLETGGSIQEVVSQASGVPEAISNEATVSENSMAPTEYNTAGAVDAEFTEEVNEEVASVMASIGFVATGEDVDVNLSLPKPDPINAAIEKKVATKGQPSHVENTSAAGVETPRLVSTDEALPIHRYEVVEELIPLPDQHEVSLAKDAVWLICDEDKNACQEFVTKLLKNKQKVVHLLFEGKTVKPIAGTKQYQLSSHTDEHIGDVIKSIREQEGVIGGLVYMQAVATEKKTIKNCFNAKDYAVLQTLFLVAKHVNDDIKAYAKNARGYFFVATQMDGKLGTSKNSDYSLVTSGVSGLVKSLYHEWNNVFCRLVDLNPKLANAEAAEILWQELADPNCEVLEVGRSDQQQRMTLTLTSADSSKAEGSSVVKADDVILVTGGARGITAECVLALAEKTKASFVLLGRTDIETPLPNWAQSCEDGAALQAAAIKELSSSGEQPTPVKIKNLLAPVTHTFEVRETLERLNKLGSKSIYLSVDVVDKKKLREGVKKAQEELGTVTGIIHAAGNLADKKIDKKTVEDFQSVFVTKVRGLENLIHVTDSSKLRHVCLFSSVSGFFGNAGQTDYAMANEVLNKFAYSSYHKKVHVKAINWGPWDSGMVNATLKNAYHNRGIAIISKQEGVQKFVNEYCFGNTQTIIGSAEYQSPKAIKLNQHTYVYQRHLSLKSNPYLSDHVVDGTSVLPATFALEWMIKTARYVVPFYKLQSMTDFKVLKGVVFKESEAQDFFIEVTALGSDGSKKAQDFEVKIFNDKDGAKLYRYSCALTLVAAREKDKLDQLRIDMKPKSAELETRGWENLALYGAEQGAGLMFHGESLQGIQQLLDVSKNHINVSCYLGAPDFQHAGQFISNDFNPYVADVCLQAIYLWGMLETDKSCLPAELGKYEQFAPLKFDEKFFLNVQINENTSTKVIASIDVVNSSGELIAKFGKIVAIQSKQLRSKLLQSV